jgi:hypothetical protein
MNKVDLQFFFGLLDVIQSLEMVNVVVPKYPTARGRASLTCNYQLGDDKLYSVKWYRDGSEFYRSIQTFK